MTDLGTFCGAVGDRDFLLSLTEGWERFALTLFQDVLEPGMNVLDGGAHIGVYTVVAARKIGVSGHVLAFEPNPVSLSLLERNTDENQVSDRVSCLGLALGASPGIAPFFLSPGNRSASSLFDPRRSGTVTIDDEVTGTEVEMVRLDEFLSPNATIDVLKLDLEGGEVGALRGMESILGRHAPITAFVECNPDALAAAESSPEELLQVLGENGFDVRAIDETAQALRKLQTRDLAAGGYVNLLCRKV